MIHPNGTFDYIATVPVTKTDAGWSAPLQLREPIPSHQTRLLGRNPVLTVSEVHVPSSPDPGAPLLPRGRLEIHANDPDSPAIRFACVVDRRLPAHWQPGDRVQISRSGNGGVALGCLRGDRLLVAVGDFCDLDLGSRVLASLPRQVMDRARNEIRRLDPGFEFNSMPVAIDVEGTARVLFSGKASLGDYDVVVRHGFVFGLPGTSATGAIWLSALYSETTATVFGNSFELRDRLARQD